MDTTQNPSTPAPASTEQVTGFRTNLLASWVKHPVTIGLAAGAGVLALVGGTIVIADEIAEEIWPDRYYVDYVDGAAAASPAFSPSGAAAPLSSVGADEELGQFLAAVDAAVAAADGVGVTETAVAGDAFELDVLLPSGREIDVAVRADGSTIVDPVPYSLPSLDPALDRDRIGAILDAARDSIGTADASAISLSTDAGPFTRYDVEFATPSGSVWVELNAELAVTEVDRDG